MRSRQPERPITQIPVGIISACAEQTTASNNTRITHRDHLRVCGADQTTNRAWGAGTGSSPRVRSRLLAGAFDVAPAGIISACAEQTARRSTSASRSPDHLRVCGADELRPVAAVGHAGSSPRVRSRPAVGRGDRGVEGIISACAEQTSRLPRLRTRRPDHLRVCGADGKPYDRWEPGGGSSPRVRSRHRLVGRACPPPGIISACAEQTAGGWYAYKAVRDHLRVCGADLTVCVTGAGVSGSSPRVRSRHVVL